MTDNLGLTRYRNRVVELRYDGVKHASFVIFNGRFIGTGWYALACDYNDVPKEFIDGDDAHLHKAIHELLDIIGCGDTPEEAYQDLLSKLY